MINCSVQSPWGGQGFFIEKTSSTMHEARLLEQQGQPEGSYVLTGEQTAGQGRTTQRIWLSPPYVNLLFTFFIFPRSVAQSSFPLSLIFGLGVCFWLESLGLQPYLKWPNDVLLLGKSIGKVCGILVTTRWEGQRPLSFHCGIGVNLQCPTNLPMAFSPASLDQFGLKLEPLQALKGLFSFLYDSVHLKNPQNEVDKRLYDKEEQQNWANNCFSKKLKTR